ncbi:TetR family transcriptional regulator [Actinomyces timonensis]|uniref:TetR family transcriptional regulator n=1 Tax=Actinomyces timonensis TaxID=1288391 RepID=A0AAU8N299_9ACTO
MRSAVETTSDRREKASTAKGEARKQAIIDAAAAIIRESGPKEVTHRAVAQRAGCSLSATTYYFDGLDDLLHQAGLLNISLWAARAERVADAVEALEERSGLDERIEYLLRATLPEIGPYLGHYLQLISAGASAPVGSAYREGRQRLNAAISRIAEKLLAALLGRDHHRGRRRRRGHRAVRVPRRARDRGRPRARPRRDRSKIGSRPVRGPVSILFSTGLGRSRASPLPPSIGLRALSRRRERTARARCCRHPCPPPSAGRPRR